MRFWAFFFISSLTAPIWAQNPNLVINGDFEEITACPDKLGQVYLAKGWSIPTSGTPDLFNGCFQGASSHIGVPDNWNGHQPAYSGNSYTGQIAYLYGNLREYVQGTLKDTLVAGNQYYVEFYVNLTKKSSFALKNFGANLGSEFLSLKWVRQMDLPLHISDTSFISEKSTWTRVSGFYTAKGGEKYIRIGNFFSDDANKPMDVSGGSSQWAYYLIDAVRLIDSCPPRRDEAILAPDTIICPGSFVIRPQKQENYIWQNGSTGAFLEVTDPGHYSASITKGNCLTYDSIWVRSYSVPDIFDPDSASCFDQSVLLVSKTEGDKYSWQDNSTTSTYTAAKPGLYALRLEKWGCSFMDSILLLQSPKPSVNLGADLQFCEVSEVELDAGDNMGFLWDDMSRWRTRKVKAPGVFYVQVVNSFGCLNSDTIRLDTFFCPPPIYVPNSFSPDNNGLNDFFAPSLPYSKEFHLAIYDRWGELLFESYDSNMGWDGMYNGIPCNSGVYLYQISYVDFYGEKGNNTGTFTLIR